MSKGKLWKTFRKKIIPQKQESLSPWKQNCKQMKRLVIFAQYCKGRKVQSLQPLFISKCSCLSLDLPLSVKGVGVSRGHRLPHCDLGASAVDPQQVLPSLLWDLTVVRTCGEKRKWCLKTVHHLIVYPRALQPPENDLALAVYVLLSWLQFYCCRWDRAALGKQTKSIFQRQKDEEYGCTSNRSTVPLSLPFTKLSHSLNHCMLIHRITVGASSAWNSLFSCTREKQKLDQHKDALAQRWIFAGDTHSPWWRCLFRFFCVWPEPRSPPDRWHTCRGGWLLGHLRNWEQEDANMWERWSFKLHRVMFCLFF